MGIREAFCYEPTTMTYAISIESPRTPPKDRYRPKDSPLYTKVAYEFDDVWPGIESIKDVLFSEGLAERIIREYSGQKENHEALLVHCARGKNRSPAVAMALNEIFSLGHDSEELKAKYKEANWFVYETMISVGRRIR